MGSLGVASKIVFLDDSADLRSLVETLLRLKLDMDCLSYARLSEMEDNASEVLRAQAVILDINLGPDEPNGIDAYCWLQSQSYAGKIIFLTGHAKSNPLVFAAARLGAEVLEKPLKTDHLLTIIRSTASGKKLQHG
jgi:DNA-binding NtrC family response regulator